MPDGSRINGSETATRAKTKRHAAPEGADVALSSAFNHLGALLLYKGSPAARTAKVVQTLEDLSIVRRSLSPGCPKIDWQRMADQGPRALAINERFELESARKALARWDKRLNNCEGSRKSKGSIEPLVALWENVLATEAAFNRATEDDKAAHDAAEQQMNAAAERFMATLPTTAHGIALRLKYVALVNSHEKPELAGTYEARTIRDLVRYLTGDSDWVSPASGGPRSMCAPQQSPSTLRPAFKPAWSKEESLEVANDNLRLDHPTAVAERMAAILMSLSSGEMLSKQIDEETFKSMTELLDDAEKKLEARLEIVRVARVRHLWCMQYKAEQETT